MSRKIYFNRKTNILSAISNRSNSQRYHVIELLKVGRCYFIRILNGNMDGVIRDQKVTGQNHFQKNTHLSGYLGRMQV